MESGWGIDVGVGIGVAVKVGFGVSVGAVVAVCVTVGLGVISGVGAAHPPESRSADNSKIGICILKFGIMDVYQ